VQQVYIESQKFRQWWLFLIIFGIMLLALWGTIQQLVFGKTFGDNPAPDAFLVGFLIVTVILCYLLIATSLKTIIDSENVFIKFGFLKRQIRMNKIKSVSIIDYGFVGGWGYRMSKEYGTIYSVSGSKGLYLVLQNGGKLVVGTQNIDELQRFIDKNMKDFNHLQAN